MFVTTIAVFVFGLALLAFGLRGRRTDDHPLCRRCRFDLTDRQTPTGVRSAGPT